MFRCCVLHHQDKQTQPGPGAPIHLFRTVALSQPVQKPPQTPGEACVMAEPWHSPCSRQHQELQGSRTWARSACCCQRWTKGERGWVQFRLSWSTFLAGVSGKLHPLWLFLSQHRGSNSSLCVPKEHTSPESLPVPALRETGTVPAWHTTSVQGASRRSHRRSQGHCPKSQSRGKTTQTHPLRIFPHLEHSSVNRKSLGGPESPQCQSSVSCGAAKPSCGSGPCWTPEQPGAEDGSSPQPAPQAEAAQEDCSQGLWGFAGSEGAMRGRAEWPRAGQGLAIALCGQQAAPSVRRRGSDWH